MVTQISPARPAVTTIVFQRDETAAPYDYRIMFIRRPDSMRNFAGLYAYPGGAVHPEDASAAAAACCAGITPIRAGSLLARGAGSHWEGDEYVTPQSSPDLRFPPPLAYWVAAARELFEEVGLLVATDASGAAIDTGDAELARWIAEQRIALLNGETSFVQILRSRNLRINAAGFYYLHRIVAPIIVKRRFDTRFFLVEMPPGQEPKPYAGEVADLIWLTPGEAMRQVAESILHPSEQQQFRLPPPTIFTLGTIQRSFKIDELLSALHDGYPIR